jgi:hypothetical protein
MRVFVRLADLSMTLLLISGEPLLRCWSERGPSSTFEQELSGRRLAMLLRLKTWARGG